MEKDFFCRIDSLDGLDHVAEQFLRYLQHQDSKFVAFNGAMGAGKTTFINALLKQMEVTDHGSSPTFAIVTQHESAKFGTIYHCDFYRLKSVEEAFDIGVEDMLNSDCWVMAEWPQKLGNLLPEKIVNVTITDQNGGRTIEASV